MIKSVALERSDPPSDRLSFLPVDPFAAKRDISSRVIGLGGPHPSDDPGYVFQSLDIYPVVGPVRFTLHFHQLVATTGTLTVQIRVASSYPGTVSIPIKTVTVPLPELAQNDGVFVVEIISRRNMVYTIGGRIDDETDSSAAALSLSVDPRERDVPLPSSKTVMPLAAPAVIPIEKFVPRPELATMQPALLARPVSQAMTERQRRDPLVEAWDTALHQPDGTDIERWQNAFVLQALHYYGVSTDSGSALCISGRRQPLPSYLAGRGCKVLVAARHHSDLPEGDPGLVLERLLYPDLCASTRFFDAVDQTVFENLAIPSGLSKFDFMWSIDVTAGPDARMHFPHMLRASFDYLQLGGVAVHILQYSGEIGATPDPNSASYGRAEIERLALSLIADGQEVAQLKFDVDQPDTPGDRHIPFALIARRVR